MTEPILKFDREIYGEQWKKEMKEEMRAEIHKKTPLLNALEETESSRQEMDDWIMKEESYLAEMEASFAEKMAAISEKSYELAAMHMKAHFYYQDLLKKYNNGNACCEKKS